MASQELAVMLVISSILLFLVNKFPTMISGFVSGGGIGNFGAGAALSTSGGESALQAASQKASASMEP